MADIYALEKQAMDEQTAAKQVAEEQAAAAAAQPQVQPTVQQLEDQYRAEDIIRNASKVPGIQPWSPEFQAPFKGYQAERDFNLEQAQAAENMAAADYAAQQAELARQQEEARIATEQKLAVQKGQEEAAQSALAKLEQEYNNKLQKADEHVAQQDQEAEKTLSEIFRDGSLGQKIGMALSILAGGISQGLTGAKENPVMSFMNKLDSEVLAKRKMSADQAAAARKAILQKLDLQLKMQKARTDDRVANANIDKTRMEIQKLQSDIEKAQQMSNMAKVGGIVDPNLLDPKLRQSIVSDPNGKPRLAYNPTTATNLTKYMSETGAVVGDLQNLIDFTKDKRFYNPFGADRARVETKISTLLGALRLPITGPGPLTDTEREFLKETIGDPSKFWSLKKNQMARLYEIQANINRRVNNAYKQAGITLDEAPATPQTQDQRLETRGITPERRQQIETFLKKRKQSKGK